MKSDLSLSYSAFDQREKLGEPPWSGPELEAWEAAHQHDARLKCYPEFGCAFAKTDHEEELEAAMRQAKGKLLHAVAMLRQRTPVNSRVLIALEDIDAAVDLMAGAA